MSTYAIARSEISALQHLGSKVNNEHQRSYTEECREQEDYKIRDDSMEEASFVMQRDAILSIAHLPGAELSEILDSPWHNLFIHSIGSAKVIVIMQKIYTNNV